jgi:hypothetical protein
MSPAGLPIGERALSDQDRGTTTKTPPSRRVIAKSDATLIPEPR